MATEIPGWVKRMETEFAGGPGRGAYCLAIVAGGSGVVNMAMTRNASHLISGLGLAGILGVGGYMVADSYAVEDDDALSSALHFTIGASTVSTAVAGGMAILSLRRGSKPAASLLALLAGLSLSSSFYHMLIMDRMGFRSHDPPSS